MQRIFKELVDRECTMCHEIVQAKYFTHCKRVNKNEIVYYQRADCKFCRAEKERKRRAIAK
jgi:hypothetical protein